MTDAQIEGHQQYLCIMMSFPSARCGDGDGIPEVGVYRGLRQIANEVGVYRVLGFFEEDQQIADEDVARQLWKTFQHVFGSDHNRPDIAGVEFRLRLLGFDTQKVPSPEMTPLVLRASRDIGQREEIFSNRR
ncbi:predicted protein [Nematostella vectensis]|uniref:Uncharacterized protein n=1 Tax=Nematostella vectensis TaxID=45351 RepID=A7SP18_NEMVE|nr:predicted protein [Nematostella vectensis]|eukprot:XP_001626661.1 predicted protein [Nematostella vectensis]